SARSSLSYPQDRDSPETRIVAPRASRTTFLRAARFRPTPVTPGCGLVIAKFPRPILRRTGKNAEPAATDPVENRSSTTPPVADRGRLRAAAASRSHRPVARRPDPRGGGDENRRGTFAR